MLKARVFTALALLALFVAALFFLPDLLWAALTLAVILVGSLEWAGIAGYTRRGGVVYLLATLGLAIVLFAAMKTGILRSRETLFLYSVSALFWLVAVPCWLALDWRVKHPAALALAGWILLIPGWLAINELRSISPMLLLGLMGLVWIADSAAYFTGRRFGRHQLAPAISPGKTWEGVAGALCAVAVYAALWGFGAPISIGLENKMISAGWVWITLAFWGLTVVSILGDLFESAMKRQAGMKDSGNLLPGHGGILDRIDSLASTLPLAAMGLTYTRLTIN